jgi:hypothetical protein
MRVVSFISCLLLIAQTPMLAQISGGVQAWTAAGMLLESAGQLPPADEPIKCGLGAVTHALAVRHAGSPGLLGAATALLTRPVKQTHVTRGGYTVHFDTTGIDTPALLDASGVAIPGSARAFVDSVFASLEYVGTLEIQTLGYGPLPSDGTLSGGPEYDIFIVELSNMYGYTTPDGSPPEGGTSTTFITIDNDFVFVRPAKNRGIPGLNVTIAHEFHHALQIGNYGFWQEHTYYHEITSTWMEDVAYPAVHDYYNYLSASWGQFRNPDRAFTSNDLICYSRGIWGQYIAKKFGRGMMRATWEQIRFAVPLTAIDRALRTQGYDVATAFAEWTLWNHFTGSHSNAAKYYTDGADYPEMTAAAVEYTPPSRDISGSLAAFASRYYQLQRSPDTMTVIVSNVDLNGALGQGAGGTYAFEFRSAKTDESYKLTPIGLYGRLNVTNPVLWSCWYVVGDTVRRNIDPASIVEGRAFPNPFLPGKHTRVALPITGDAPVSGSVAVYTSGMDLVYASGNVTSTWYLDRQMFFWDGTGNDGATVPSGVYFYVVDLGGRRVTGKIALVRR